MKFKDIAYSLLTEKSRSKPVSGSLAADIIRKKCGSWHPAKHTHIWRGLDNQNDFLHVDPSKSVRKSFNTRNFYTLLIDNHPKWKAFPKRSRSLICASDLHTTDLFGQPYLVIPYDGAKIAVCPEIDLWYAFKDTMGKQLGLNQSGFLLTDLNDLLSLLYKKLTGGHGVVSDDSFNNMLKDLSLFTSIKGWDDEKIDEVFGKTTRGWNLGDVARTFRDSKYDTFIDFLFSMFPPNRFSIEMSPASGIPPKREIWTEGPAVLVYKHEIKSLFHQLYPDYDIYQLPF